MYQRKKAYKEYFSPSSRVRDEIERW